MVAPLGRALGVLLFALTACEESAPPPAELNSDAGLANTPRTKVKPKPTAKATAAPLYPDGMWQPIRDDTQRKSVGDVAIITRTFLGKVSTSDPVALALRFESASVRGSLDWSASLGTTRFVITAGTRTEELELAAAPTVSDVSQLTQRARVLLLEPTGLRQFATTMPWKVPSKLLGQPGEVTVRLRGDMVVDGSPLPFETAPMQVTVEATGEDLQSLASLQGMAARLVEKTEQSSAPPAPLGQPVDDVADNRVFRFRVDRPTAEYDMHVVDVAMSPRGGFVGARSFDHFTCLAEGTAIATPRGDRPIETITVGDVVWGFDTERMVRIETRVLATGHDFTSELFVVEGLRITAQHPVFAGGSWVASHRLTPAHALLGFDLTERPITRVEVVATHEPVFDLDVSWPNNFFAASVLVHNKAAHVPLGPRDDPWQGLFSRALDKPPTP